MPLSPIQKKELIRNAGFDPANHYMDEATGDVFEGSDPNEIAAPELPSDVPPAPRPDTSSATKVFAKSFAQGIGPTGVSIAGGALASQAVPAAWAGAPWTNLAAGLAGGIAAGFAAEKAQSAIVPQSVQDSIFPSAIEQQDHPVAAQLGNLASAAPFLNPVKGAQSLIRGGGLVKDLITKPVTSNAILTAAEKEGLRNLAVNTGVGVASQVGVDTAQQLASDQPFDYQRAGINALGGLILNEPTKLAQRRLGMKPSFEGVPTRGEILANREGLSSANRAPIGAEPYVPTEMEKSSYGTEYNEPAYQINPKALGQDGKFVVDDNTINQIFNREYPKLKGASKIEGEGLVPNTKVELTVEQKRDFLDQVMRERIDTAEDFGQPIGPEIKPLEVANAPEAVVQQAPAQPQDFYSRQKTKGRQVDITQRQEYNPNKQGPYKYSEETTPLAIDVRKQEIDAAVDEALKKRGMTMGTYGKPIVDSNGNPVLGRNTGNRIAGNVDTTRREMNISDKGGPDTAFHEVGHQQLMDLATSADPKDRELVGRIFAEHGKPEITAEKFLELNRAVDEAVGRGDTTTADAIREQFLAAEEEIVQYAGLESSSRKLEKKTLIPKAKQYIKDYASRLGMGDKPATQQLSARQEYEAPYGTRDVEAPRVETQNTSKQSEVPSKYGAPQENDYEAYLDVQRRISVKIKAGEFEGEEFKKLWQENEDIKNRNGGMPPKEKTKVEEPIKKTDTKQSEVPSKYKERSEDTFELSTQKVLRNPKPFGLSPDKDGKFAGNTVADKLPSSIPKMELEILKKAGIEDFLRYKRRSASEIEEWVKEHGPKVQTHSYGMEGKVSEAKKELDKMRHEWYDNLPKSKRDLLLDAEGANYTGDESGVTDALMPFTPEERVKALRYLELDKQTMAEAKENKGNNPRATSAYDTVSAFSTKEPMPEWTKTRGGKNVQRVDVVIPHTGTGKKLSAGNSRNDPSVIWDADNLHENLPNTLGWAMIQYKNGPKGEKVAVVVEAQSRWAQNNRKILADPGSMVNRGKSKLADHPLLRDYNRLILKAAIDQARKEGATHIVVSDGKSALMTEMLDTQYKKYANKELAEQAAAKQRTATDNYQAVEHGGEWYVTKHEKGFDFAYDTSLPKIAEELTGSKGEKVSLGEHKNAYDKELRNRPSFDTEADAIKYAEENGLNAKESVYQSPAGIWKVETNNKRSNLIFRNPDGTPKTDVSGQMYPIDNVSSRLSQEPFTLTDKKFSETLSKYKPTEDPNILPKKSLFSFTTSVSDKIVEGKESSPIHRKVSEALRNYFLDSDKNAGKYGQSIARLYSKYNAKDIDAHYKDRWERDNGIKKGTSLTGKALELDNAFQSLIEKPKIDAAAEGLKVKDGDDYRVGGIKKDGYLYNMFDPEILHKLDNEPTSIESKRSLRQWKEWLIKKGMDAPEAQESIDAYLRARRDYGDTGGPEFGAMRKAEGMGLPWELIDKNPARAALRYGKRAGNDLAYFKNLQKDPELLKALGLKDQFQKNPEGLEDVDYIGNEKNVQDAMKYVWGKNVNSNPRFAALMRVAGNLVMGHGTAIRNIAAIPAQMSVYDVKLKDVFNGLSKLSSTRERAYETGAVRVNTSEYEYLGDLGNPDPWVKNLDKMSEFLRKWQGRNMSDKFEGEFIYSVGEEWAKNMLATKNIDMLKRASGKSDYEIPKSPSQEDIADLAAGFTRLVRGSYGPTGLPNWALTGNVAPFVALNRYGIEKWNNVNKDVIQPLKKGNIKPFLSYTLASLGTGAMIEEMNQLLSNKKGSDLNIQESLAAYAETEDPEILSQKVIGLMQMASYAGIVSDFAKMASRAAAGKEISYSNPVGMPLYTLATETFAENFGGMLGAIRDGEDPIGAMSQFVKSFAVNTIQASRYAAGHIEKDETERKESFGDYRKYQEATGKSSREELKASKGNPYQDMDAKKFKKTDDLKEAAEMMPSLIQRAIKNANGDPYKLKAEFRKLKSNNFQTMPSPETQPTEFYEYVNYLNKTIGPEKTALRVQKFFTQRAVNKAKNTMVP